MNSPFACDFGNDNNGMHFLDGTGEQDVSLTELLDEVFHNNDDFFCEESTNVKNSVVASGQSCTLYNIPPGSSRLNGACSDLNTEMAQVFSSLFYTVMLLNFHCIPSCWLLKNWIAILWEPHFVFNPVCSFQS